jgi:uncharacterized protein (TIGR02270 family)
VAALEAVRAARLGGPRGLAIVEWALRSPVSTIRDAAIESGLVLGLRAAWSVCQKVVEAKAPGAELAMLALALGGDGTDFERLLQAAFIESLRPAALFALGFTGRAAAVEACLPHLHDPKVARIAGEAFSAITGLAIRGEFQAAEPKAPEEPIPLEQEDLDADLVPGPAAFLPLPAAAAVEAWWKKTGKAKLGASARYIGGMPYTAESVRTALAEGPMRRRHALALELAVRTRGEFLLETRGWAADQLLQEPASWPDFAKPFGKLMRA